MANASRALKSAKEIQNWGGLPICNRPDAARDRCRALGAAMLVQIMAWCCTRPLQVQAQEDKESSRLTSPCKVWAQGSIMSGAWDFRGSVPLGVPMVPVAWGLTPAGPLVGSVASSRKGVPWCTAPSCHHMPARSSGWEELQQAPKAAFSSCGLSPY